MFKSIFGIDKNKIKETCLLVPFLPRGLLRSLEIDNPQKGEIYSCGNSHNFTLIVTRVGAGFTGDCVLYLKDSPCKRTILFGSCGLVQKTPELGLGSLVTAKTSMAMESFSDLLEGKLSCKEYSADPRLLGMLSQGMPNIKIVKTACVGSIMLEPKYTKFFVQNGVETLEMESSAFFSAAKASNIKAAALFYVTDILGKIKSEAKSDLNESFDCLLTFLESLK
ncbi:MAG: hypothetical protein HQL27_04395 [Candidatus Omnitrophica bacterium]|nr:hypothetical protein [Candidatus Omnitrophota bacterium]